MLNRKVPLLFVIVTFILTAIISSTICLWWSGKRISNSTVSYSPSYAQSCNYNISRLNGYKFIEPLVFAEEACESVALNPLKSEIENIINSYKMQGVITSASVYLRKFQNNDWISVNDNEKYSPGSLLKVPELMAFYKMNELHPGILEKKILYSKPTAYNKTPVFVSKSIVPGNTYTIRELLYDMIVYSDNQATLLLNQNIDLQAFNKVFTDIGLSEPDPNASEYLISAKDYSLFMKELFNASYLSIEDSEYCTELLVKANFDDGLQAGLPADCKLANKFGEGGTNINPEFSESGIVYLNNNDYLITVMTKGTDIKKLPQVVSSISRAVYRKISLSATATGF